nr:zf-CCHC domain-containing protein/UBN2 domain-containing protein [Tanacetum cinerariifolium]
THQGNSQVKDNKIDLLVQQYKQFTILEEESIDSGFARFNTIITSLKSLNEGFSSKNYVWKFIRALHPKWRAKVTVIEESKDLSSLALDDLISNLIVHEVVMKKDFKIYRGKKERVKSIALKAKKNSSDDETSTSKSDDEEYDMVVRNFKKFFRRKGKFVRQLREEKKSFRQRDEKKGKSDRKCFRCGDPNHLTGDCPKPPHNKNQKAFIGGSWSDSRNDAEDKTNDETCLMAQSSNEEFDNEVQFGDYCDAQGITHNFSTPRTPLVAQGYNQQEGIDYDETYAPIASLTSQNLCDDFAKIMHYEFEMSMMGELNFFLGLQIKQMEDGIFFNQSKYIKEMLNKFGLEDSKPTKTPMSTKIKLTKDDEVDFVDSSKYRDITLQFILHYRMMNSINRKNERKIDENEKVKLDIPYSPSSLEISNQSSPLLGYWSFVDQF